MATVVSGDSMSVLIMVNHHEYNAVVDALYSYTNSSQGEKKYHRVIFNILNSFTADNPDL